MRYDWSLDVGDVLIILPERMGYGKLALGLVDSAGYWRKLNGRIIGHHVLWIDHDGAFGWIIL